MINVINKKNKIRRELLSKDEDRLCIQFIADIVKSMNIKSHITVDDLYKFSEREVLQLIQNCEGNYIKNAFQNKVLPAYREIIKQLNRDDAKLLKLLYKNEYNVWAISLQIHTENQEDYSELDNYIIYNFKIKDGITGFSTLKLNPLTTDNLLMHRLIEVDYTRYYPDRDKEYETLFDSVKNKYKLQENSSLSYEKGIIKLTNFGLNFIEICIS